MASGITSHLIENSKLKPKDALQKRYLWFSSKHLPKDYSILFTILYKRNDKERYLNEAYS